MFNYQTTRTSLLQLQIYPRMQCNLPNYPSALNNQLIITQPKYSQDDQFLNNLQQQLYEHDEQHNSKLMEIY